MRCCCLGVVRCWILDPKSDKVAGCVSMYAARLGVGLQEQRLAAVFR